MRDKKGNPKSESKINPSAEFFYSAFLSKAALIFFSANLLALAHFAIFPAKENFSDAEEKPAEILSAPLEEKDDYWKTFSPAEVKAVYLTANSAYNKKKMDEIIGLMNETELNAVVIDVKDGDGVYLDDKMKALVERLVNEEIFPIARITVFFDNDLAKRRSELALKNQSGSLWRNRRGDYWVDPSSKEVWDYNAKIAKEAILLGFKEIQFDYVRFPSDGSLKAIKFPFWNPEEKSRVETIRSFFEYITTDLRAFKKDIILSADIFAFTFLVEEGDDLGIGQTVGIALPYFDFISPMIYPSHYSEGNFGFQNPAEHPYEVVFGTLEKGKKFFGGGQNEKTNEQNKTDGKIDDVSVDMLQWQKIRPWVQDFNLGAFYGKEFLEKQKQAVYDQNLKSWLFWNPRNNYSKDKY